MIEMLSTIATVMFFLYSDWGKAFAAYMDNPLVNVDCDAMERTVTEAQKTINKCFRTFMEMPGR